MRVLVLGDIVGEPGCRAVYRGLPALKSGLGLDLVVANAENAADGAGLTPAICAALRDAGVDVVTSGNHVWQSAQTRELLEGEERLLRPQNYPEGVPGRGVAALEVHGVRVVVANLEGRKAMSALRCPFLVADEVLRVLGPSPGVVIVDFHAEAADEKEALGIYLDGRVSAVIGTHTHVQTADERVLPGGTGYLTDVGMCGSPFGVIGMDSDESVRRYVSQMPIRMEVDDGPGVLRGAVVAVEEDTGRCMEIRRLLA